MLLTYGDIKFIMNFIVLSCVLRVHCSRLCLVFGSMFIELTFKQVVED